MLIVRIMGGLGNQMFQYALYKKLIQMGKNVKIDISSYNNYQKHNGYELERIFKIHPAVCSLEEAMRYIEPYQKKKKSKKLSDRFFKIIERFLFSKKLITPAYINQMEHPNSAYLLRAKNGYLSGYWQGEKFFHGAEDAVIADFAFDIEKFDAKNKEIAKEIINANSVSIHIRRGDYYSDPDSYKILGDICGLDYYNKALQKIVDLVSEPIFYVFSDEPQWVKENLNIPNAHYIDWNRGESSFNDMLLMSLCKHNIIANSSFSWWGAYLNRNNNKIVLAPGTWNRITKNKSLDIVPANWIRI